MLTQNEPVQMLESSKTENLGKKIYLVVMRSREMTGTGTKVSNLPLLIMLLTAYPPHDRSTSRGTDLHCPGISPMRANNGQWSITTHTYHTGAYISMKVVILRSSTHWNQDTKCLPTSKVPFTR